MVKKSHCLERGGVTFVHLIVTSSFRWARGYILNLVFVKMKGLKPDQGGVHTHNFLWGGGGARLNIGAGYSNNGRCSRERPFEQRVEAFGCLYIFIIFKILRKGV